MRATPCTACARTRPGMSATCPVRGQSRNCGLSGLAGSSASPVRYFGLSCFKANPAGRREMPQFRFSCFVSTMPRKFAADIDENVRWNAPSVKLLSFDLCNLTLACAVETLARWGFSGPDQGDANTAERSYSRSRRCCTSRGRLS
jgi:hypothetical protein